jgi:hypothetical protein
MIRKFILLVILLFCLVGLSRAQVLTPELISSGGDFFTASNGSLSWSFGEPVTETYKTSSVVLTQGFQQPGYNVTAIDDKSISSQFRINVYPNPASDYLNIEMHQDKQTMVIEIYDLFGRKVLSENPVILNNSTYQVNMAGLAKGNYLLVILLPDIQDKLTYKLVKF